MSSDTSAPARASIKPGQTLIQGRCTHVRTFSAASGRRFAHLVALPAPDAYSHPGLVEVVASQRLADTGADVSFLCNVTGVSNSFKSADRETGEIKQIQSATIRLNAVE